MEKSTSPPHGDGTFQAPVTIEPLLYNSLANVAAGDINGDGWTDLVFTEELESYIYVLLNNHHGGFTETKINVTYKGTLTDPTQIILTDLRGNGKLDIVTATAFGAAEVYLGNGAGNFTYAGQLVPGTLSDTGSTIAVSDVNGDGIPDLVITQASVGTVGIFLGKGNGTFQPPYLYGAGTSPSDILLGNQQGQSAACGFPDILVPDLTGGIMVLLNLTASKCPGL